jgi:pilus assembly protein CpaB
MRIKPKMILTVALAVLAGLVASVATSKYFGRQAEPAPVEENVTVLVATQRVPGYTTLDDPKQWFELKTYPKGEVPADAIGDIRKARGRTLRAAIEAGKVLTEKDLLPPGQEPLVAKLREGERLMTVKVTLDSAAGGFILPGSRVDVVATQMRGEGNQPYAHTILQNIEVLAIDQQPQIPEGTIAKTYDRVTLRVTLEQAEILSVYADTGSLRLVVRRPDDAQEVKTKWGLAELAQTPGRTGYGSSCGNPTSGSQLACFGAATECPPALQANHHQQRTGTCLRIRRGRCSMSWPGSAPDQKPMRRPVP